MRTNAVRVSLMCLLLCGCPTGGTYIPRDLSGQRDGGTTAGDSGARDLPFVGGKRIFITAAAYTGNLQAAAGAIGGIEGGDQLCTAAAQGAGLGGAKWIAWLSNSDVSALSRVVDVGPWSLLNGTKVFNNKTQMQSLPLVLINVTETGAKIDSFGDAVWTGTETGGARAAANCTDWLDAASGNAGTVGRLTSPQEWTRGETGAGFDLLGCSSTAHLYCIEQ